MAARWTGLFGVRVEHVHSGAGPVRGYDIDVAPPGSAMMTQAEAAAFNARPRVRRDDNLDATALFRFEASRTLAIDFGIARKSRSPNLYERYTWSSWPMAAAMNNFVGDGNGYVGDPALRPEVAHSLSASLDWRSQDGRHRLLLSPWYTRVDDFIDAQRITANAEHFNVLRHTNQDARLAGVDLSGHWALADSALGSFDLHGVIGYIDAENRDSDDGLYQIMPLNARIALEHRQGRWSSRLELLGVARKDSLSEVRNEVETPGYGLLSLRLGYSLRQLRIDLGIDNLLDRNYVQPLGGSYVGQGRTMSLTGIPHGIGVPGPGRSLQIGFSLEF
jgi:iron complex outermembrane receptor protein